MDVLQIAVKERRLFRVGGREYALCFPLSLVAELEEKLGRSMKMAADWLRIETKEVPTVLETGFRYYHPDEAKAVAKAICDALDPEEIEHVIEALCIAACPKAMERIKAAMEEAQARLKRGLLPNAESADAT